jgi:TonB-linked SusC/RagA family outer membrane protein
MLLLFTNVPRGHLYAQGGAALALGGTQATAAPAGPVADIPVSGTVTADDGSGLPGVSVLVKGTTNGTATDAEGRFKLTVPDNGTLVFSFIGYTTQEVPIAGKSTINVKMAADVESLGEVVVVGYGTQKKETVTGSVATVKGSDLVKSPAVNLSNSIAGRMPGVIAVNRSGEPGYDGSGIRIRGSNTLGNNNALIVIDGVPARQGGFERLNPADIENISVLKDASAAIYGARAANGVILITTKRGKNGKPELSYSYNQGLAQPTVLPQLADATQYAEMRNELEVYQLPASRWGEATQAFRETGVYNYVDDQGKAQTRNAPYKPDDFQKFRDGSDPWGHPNTNWYDATLKNWSPQSRHNLQLTGGSENFKYLASLGYQNQDAYYKNSATGYKQYDLRINLDANVNKYIKTSLGITGRQENRFFPTVSAGSIFRMQMRGIPTQPAFWPNGMPGPDIENGQNPVVITTDQTGYDRDTRYYLQTNGSVDITIPGVTGLKFTGTAAVDKFIKQTRRWDIPWYLYTWDKTSYEADGVTPKLVRGKRGPAEPSLRRGNEDQLNILLGGLLTYDRKFGDHAMTLLAGVNRETIDFESFGAFRRYFISDAVDQFSAGGNAERNNSGGAWERARLNYFGRVAYNFREKYLVEFLWRYDGSYMFPENTRYGFFPGIMAGWQISEESFFKNNVNFVNYLKLRGSWGQMGNDNITLGQNDNLLEYQFLSTNAFRTHIIGGQEVLTLFETRVPNPTITWEVANNSNIGLEGQLMQGKINFEIDAFYNKRTNILWPKYGSIPQTTGMTLPPQNIGKVANRGIDFLLGYNGQAGELKYNFSVNAGYAKNKILFWDEAPGAPEWQRSTGRPMNTPPPIYLFDGVFRDQADIDANTLDYTAVSKGLRPGDMKFKDHNGDGKITPDDQVRIEKNDIPTLQGGLNMGASYKNFDLSVLFQGSAGALMFISSAEMGSIGNYLLDMYENRWTVDNPSSDHPRIADRGNEYYSFNNTYWLRNTDYIRLKNVELGYTIPQTLTQKVGMNNLRIYLNGLNVFTLHKLKVYDPENVNGTGQYYPQARIINGGLTVTF